MAQLDDVQIAIADITNGIREGYLPMLQDVRDMFGEHAINGLITRTEASHSDGITLQFRTGYRTGGRMNSDVNAIWQNTPQHTVDKIKYRYNIRTAGSNDHRTIKCRGQLHYDDLVEAAQAPEAVRGDHVLNLMEELVGSVMGDFDYVLGTHRYTPISARLVQVNGNVAENDADTFAACSSFTSGDTSIRFVVDNGSIHHLSRGQEIDIYNTAESANITGIVTDVNIEDLSVGVDITTGGGAVGSAGDWNNGGVYFSGQRNQGYHGLDDWMSNPTAGESWIGGVDRTNKDFRWLQPKRLNANGGAVSMTQFERLAQHMQLSVRPDAREAGNIPSIIMNTRQYNKFRTEVGQDGSIRYNDTPAGDVAFGHESLSFVFGRWGRIRLMEDPKCDPAKVYFIDPSTWCQVRRGGRGPEMMPGRAGYSPTSDQAGAQGGGMLTFWDAILLGAGDACLFPAANGYIDGLADPDA